MEFLQPLHLVMDIFSAENSKDLDALKNAVQLLNTPSITSKMANLVGGPIEWSISKLPKGAKDKVNDAVKAALHKSLDTAVRTMDDTPSTAASTKLHKWGAAATGALGGFFGFSTMLLELPVSVTIMMRAVADIARAEGFKLSDFSVQLDCLTVFALDGNSTDGGATDTGLYMAKAGLHNLVNLTAAELAAIAAERAAENITAREGAAFLARFIDAVAARFGVVITEKMAAQIVPVLGAVAGAALNTLFTDHYQDLAQGYFTRKRLALKYGDAEIQVAYANILAGQPAPSAA